MNNINKGYNQLEKSFKSIINNSNYNQTFYLLKEKLRDI